MPVMPGYTHADTPHEKTIQREGYRYGCHNTQRGGSHSYPVQDGWTDDGRRNMIQIVTDWLPRKCGTTYEPAMGPCAGCTNNTLHPPA